MDQIVSGFQLSVLSRKNPEKYKKLHDLWQPKIGQFFIDFKGTEVAIRKCIIIENNNNSNLIGCDKYGERIFNKNESMWLPTIGEMVEFILERGNKFIVLIELIKIYFRIILYRFKYKVYPSKEPVDSLWKLLLKMI